MERRIVRKVAYELWRSMASGAEQRAEERRSADLRHSGTMEQQARAVSGLHSGCADRSHAASQRHGGIARQALCGSTASHSTASPSSVLASHSGASLDQSYPRGHTPHRPQCIRACLRTRSRAGRRSDQPLLSRHSAHRLSSCSPPATMLSARLTAAARAVARASCSSSRAASSIRSALCTPSRVAIAPCWTANCALARQQQRIQCRAFSAAAPTSSIPASAPADAAQATAAAAASTSTASSEQQSNSSSGSDSNSGSSSDKSTGPDFNADPLGSDRGIALWLFGCSALVFGMVTLGGLTRLTKSGLSMVEWKPTSIRPPRNDLEWAEEFSKYQEYPEYKRVNNQMSLDQFKFIYMMEFSHRLLGRTVGVVFGLPFVYFVARGRVNMRLARRLALAFGMGGAQGFIGWWMVRSGLENPHETKQSGQVHVSPYRLATHLISAFAIYALLFTTALRVLPSSYSRKLVKGSADWVAMQQFFKAPPLKRVRQLAAATTAIVACTVFSGAYVAGNEAGLCYNEWPLMGGRIVPQDLVSPYLHPVWRNVFENSTTVQFEHRMLAYTTTAVVVAAFLATRRAGAAKEVRALIASSPLVHERFRAIQRAAHSTIGMVSIQVSLGVATLLTYVPVSLATLHQAGSLTLLTFALWLLHTTRDPTCPRISSQVGAAWLRKTGASKEALAAFLARQPPGLAQDLRRVMRDLSQGRVHKGTALAALAAAMMIATGWAACQLLDIMQQTAQEKPLAPEEKKQLKTA